MSLIAEHTASKRLVLASAFLLLALVGLFAADLLLGTVGIPAKVVWSALLGGREMEEKYRILILESRLPRAITAILGGAALATCGLLMQTFFRNPVAGPYILGISSGASLGVALLLLGQGSAGLLAHWASGAAPGVVMAASGGAALTMGAMLLLATRVRDPATLLVFGLMMGSFTGALVSLLQYQADAASLRDFVYWTFGSLDHTHWQELGLLAPLLGGCFGLGWLLSGRFDLLALGDDYARSMGLAVNFTRAIAIVLTALMAGAVTAYCGPISFIGVAVPHAVRALSGRTSHLVLWPLCALGGAVLLLACDLISRMPGMDATLPINAVTALVGAPAVAAIVWRMRRISSFFQSGA